MVYLTRYPGNKCYPVIQIINVARQRLQDLVADLVAYISCSPST